MSKDEFYHQPAAPEARRNRFSPMRAVARAMGHLYGGKPDEAPAMAPAVRTEGMTGPAPQPVTGEQTAERSGEGLAAILNAMLALDGLEGGELARGGSAFDLDGLVAAVRDDFIADAEARGIGLELAVSPSAQGRYRGEALLVRQILLNLVSNALRFTAAGGVSIVAERCDDRLKLSVADTGVGIGGSQLQRLLAPRRPPEGARLRPRGLMRCREAVERLGGSFTATSLPGEGSRFTAILPLVRVAEAGTSEPQAAAPQPSFSAREPTFEPGLRVLVADGDAISRLVLTTLLADLGLEAVTVEDADEALAAWRQEAWDLILLDVTTPTVAGLAVAKAIRAAEGVARWSRTPMLALISAVTAEGVSDYQAAGVDGHVAKPIGAAALHDAIDAALSFEAAQPARDTAAA